MVYLITGSESLPLNGFRHIEFRIDLCRTNKSHTCDEFKYVEIPNTVLQGSDEEVRDSLNNILSYDSVVASGQSILYVWWFSTFNWSTKNFVF